MGAVETGASPLAPPTSPSLALARPAGLGGRPSRLSVCGSEMVGGSKYALEFGVGMGEGLRVAVCRLGESRWVS